MKTVSRIMILFFTTALVWPSGALGEDLSAWEKRIDCNHDETVIDHETSQAQERFQIVFRNQKTIGELLQTGAVNTRRLTSLSEIVLNLSARQPAEQGWVSDADAYEEGGSLHIVRFEANQLEFQAYRTARTAAGGYDVLYSIGQWTFGPCEAVKSLTEKQ